MPTVDGTSYSDSLERQVARLTEENDKLRERVAHEREAHRCAIKTANEAVAERDAAQARVAEAEDLIARSAPLAWAAASDMNGAGEWEKLAFAWLNRDATALAEAEAGK